MQRPPLSEFVYRKRKEKGLTQEEMAELIDYPYNCYSNFELGKTISLSPKNMLSLAKGLDTDLVYLYNKIGTFFDLSHLGDNIRLARLKKGYTIPDLAVLVGVKPLTIKRIEYNETKPSIRNLHALCEELELNYEEMKKIRG